MNSKESYKSWLQVQVDLQQFTKAEYTAGYSTAAKTVEFLYFPCLCFPIQGSVYSLFTLFEDQALKLLVCSIFVLSCSGLSLLLLTF